MTRLLVARDAVREQHPGRLVARLPDCLQGDWALLFSNPEDFAPHASTPPGFLTHIAEQFRHARTRPFAVIHQLQQSLATTWLQHATDDRSLLVLDCAASPQVVDLATQTLMRKLRQLQPPYVLVLDERGHCRSTLCYRAQRVDRLRTVAELLCLIAALRGDHDLGSSAPAGSTTATLTP